MWNDPIIDEIHAIRAKIAAENGNDLRKISEYCQMQQSNSPKKAITLSPRRPLGWVEPSKKAA
jgi:hypothetical protein